MCKRFVSLHLCYTGTFKNGLDSGLNWYSQQLILLVSQAKNKTGWVN